MLEHESALHVHAHARPSGCVQHLLSTDRRTDRTHAGTYTESRNFSRNALSVCDQVTVLRFGRNSFLSDTVPVSSIRNSVKRLRAFFPFRLALGLRRMA